MRNRRRSDSPSARLKANRARPRQARASKFLGSACSRRSQALAASAAGVGLALWTRPAVPVDVPAWFPWVVPAAAAVVAMLAETMPVRMDDNVTVPRNDRG